MNRLKPTLTAGTNNTYQVSRMGLAICFFDKRNVFWQTKLTMSTLHANLNTNCRYGHKIICPYCSWARPPVLNNKQETVKLVRLLIDQQMLYLYKTRFNTILTVKNVFASWLVLSQSLKVFKRTVKRHTVLHVMIVNCSSCFKNRLIN